MTVKNCSVVLLALVVGCAEGAPVEGDDDPVDARAGKVNASEPGDDDPDAGEPEGEPDAGVVKPGDPDAAPLPVDAAPAPPDAAPAPPDAAPPVCQTTQLLVNPAFDATPDATGWVQNPAVLSNDAPVAPHTAPNSVWFGGRNLRSETLYQELAIPAGATELSLIVKWQIRNPDLPSGIYDTVALTVRDTSNRQLHAVRQWSNQDGATSSWQADTFTIPISVAGQRVRLHFAGTTDISGPTSFQFDSLELNATVCP
jgi:hypothetical protein